MSTKTAAEPSKPDQRIADFEAAKAAFETAKKKTAEAEGRTPAPVKAEEPEAEQPAPKPEKKPAKAKKAPEPKPEPSALEKQVALLTAKLDAALTPKEPEPQPDEALEGVRAKLTERFGEDEAGALMEALETLHAPSAKRLAQLEKILEQATQAGRQSISKANQKRLAAEYPQLKRDEAWQVLHSQALAAFERDPKAYPTAEDAYDALALALYGEAESEETEEDDEEAPEDAELAASRIAASSMTAPGRTRKEPRTLEEKHRELHAFIVKHPDDKAGHRRLGRELGLRP